MDNFLIGFWVGFCAFALLMWFQFRWDEHRRQKKFSEQKQEQQKRHHHD